MSILSKVIVNEHPDRVSVSFSEDAADVECIITVTFDRNVVQWLTERQIVAEAKMRLAGLPAEGLV